MCVCHAHICIRNEPRNLTNLWIINLNTCWLWLTGWLAGWLAATARHATREHRSAGKLSRCTKIPQHNLSLSPANLTLIKATERERGIERERESNCRTCVTRNQLKNSNNLSAKIKDPEFQECQQRLTHDAHVQRAARLKWRSHSCPEIDTASGRQEDRDPFEAVPINLGTST